jgi:hypothetical protein
MADPKSPRSSKLIHTHRSLVASTRGMSTGMLLGSGFAVATGGLGWLGHLGDVKYNTHPWLAVGGVCLGFLYGGVEVWKLTRESTSPDPETPEESARSEVESETASSSDSSLERRS